MSNDRDQWFNNKELYLLIQNLQVELQDTRQAIKKYNNLYEKLNGVRQDVDELKAQQKGKKEFGEQIRSWGGWVISIIMMLIALSQFFL